MWKFLFIVFVVLYLASKFMEGYNRMDTPSQVRKISKAQQQQVEVNKLEQEKEILQLKKEIEELKKK